MKRTLFVLAIAAGALSAAALQRQQPHAASFTVVEAGIPEMRDAMAKGRVTSRELVAQYLMRIATYEHRLHAALAINPRPDPRDATFDGRPALQTGGSSSGIGTAASFWAANVGSDTGGSVISPSNANMLVSIRPTIGRISRYGVIPITADHDTAGPMARTVADAAILLGALEGAAPDPHDSATTACAAPPGRDYTKFLKPGALKGARIGIPRAYYYDRVTLPGEDRARGGLNPAQAKAMADAIAILKEQGAVIVDPADIPSFVDRDPNANFLLW